MSGPLDRGWGQTICVASGSSFTVEQAARIAGARAAGLCRVIVVNDNWQRIPNADVLYACDFDWWRVHLAAIRASGFAGELWTHQDDAFIASDAGEARRDLELASWGLNFIKTQHGNALLPRDPPRICYGSNGGFQAIMLARLFGARTIALVGYDCSGADHWFGAHQGTLANGNAKYFIPHFEAVARPLREDGVDVINCTAKTALTCFRAGDLAATLAAF